MTDPITPVFVRVIRPLLAALLGLAIAQGVGKSQENNGADPSLSVIVHIPAA